MNNIAVFAIFSASALLLSIALYIDTTSWWIRSLANKDNIGLYISRSNIYLYGGRFFSLLFVVLLSFSIETGLSPAQVALCCFFTFSLCTLLHLTCAVRNFDDSHIISLLARALILPKRHPFTANNLSYFFNARLFYSTTFATFAFSVGSGAPLLLASIFIDYRLSMANIGQLINSLGMLSLLFFVDQSLFKSLDSGLIIIDVKTYTYGRILGFIISALLYFVIFWII